MTTTMTLRCIRSTPFAPRLAWKRGKAPAALRVTRRLQLRVKKKTRPSASASSDSTKTTTTATPSLKQDPKTVKQYAGLHDFCMTIPYGAVVALVGLAGVVTGQGNVAGILAIAGIASCVSSALSLKAWRAGLNNTRYTLASSGLALGVGAVTWRSTRNGGSSLVGKILLTMSAAMVVFLVYNIASGGNPPKRKS